ncbi:hypothetical protein I4U23_026892 [Adineta vaga]|nr:hypothetical protein I4U23_026892 [Adineta vaga]
MIITVVADPFHPSAILPCRVQGFFLILSANQLMYSHCVAAISRVLTIVYAHKHFFRSRICIWTSIGSGWLVALFISLYDLFIDNFGCLNVQGASFLTCYTLVTTFGIPIVIITICNGRILRYVRQSTRQIHATGSRALMSHARDVHLFKVMIITFVVFLVGWAPVFIIRIFGMNENLPRFLDNILQILPSLTMLHDVLFLMLTNQPIRLFLKQLLVRRV